MSARKRQLLALMQDRHRDGTAWVWHALPKLPPSPWLIVQGGQPDDDGYACRNAETGMHAIVSGATEDDSRRWLHLSLSYANHLPNYDDLTAAKEAFFGPHLYAYQVFPSRRDHINIHNFCLHLFACVDAPEGRALPDFTGGTGSI